MATKTNADKKLIARYHQFIRGLELESIWLSRADLQLHGVPNDILRTDSSINMKPVDASYDQLGSDKAIIATCHALTVENQYNEEVISIQVDYKVEYTTTIAFDDELMDLFSHAVLPSHVLPYLREYVQNSFVRMGLPPLTLPMWKSPFLTQKDETKSKRKSPKSRGKKTATKKKSRSTKSAGRPRSQTKT